MQKAPPEVEVGGVAYKIRPFELKSIQELAKEATNKTPEDISAALGLRVVAFDETNIYHGSKLGLKLHYKIVGEQAGKRVLVFSFGEFQPGRFLCKFESVLDLNS